MRRWLAVLLLCPALAFGMGEVPPPTPSPAPTSSAFPVGLVVAGLIAVYFIAVIIEHERYCKQEPRNCTRP